MDLQQYDRTKSALAELLRTATMRAMPETEKSAVSDLFARLAEDRFNLVVVGRFSRGKSSLMNAMLGADRLPTGIVPVTSVITTVTYDSEEKVVLHYQHTSLFFEIPISELADHITERGNPGNRRRIKTADVLLPAELLRRGFHFIDTPGLGSAIAENTRTTEAFLPEADAFVVVTSYDSPLSEDEQRVLELVHRYGRRCFVVVNKQDAVDPQQRPEVIEHLSSRLHRIFGATIPSIFSVSAQQALAARLQGNAPALAESGLPGFETALLRFLMVEKRREFLLGMASRIGEILGRQPGAEADLVKLRALQTEIAEAQPASIDVELRGLAETLIAPNVPECEICKAVMNAIFSFIAQFQYQLHGNRQAQAELAKRRGLCGPHTWQFETIAAPREICTGFAAVAEHQAGYLRIVARNASSGVLACQAVQNTLPDAGSCAACDVARKAAQDAAAAAAARFDQAPAEAIGASSAICLTHLPLLLGAMTSPAAVKAILLREADLLDRFAEDMRHFALKRDGFRRHLTTKEEVSAAERALRLLVENPRAQMGSAPDDHGPTPSLTRQSRQQR